MSTARIGLLGGTFDPIHVGHLASARAAADALDLRRLLFIPSHIPPHRPDRPRASGYHRWQMTALAVAGTPGWEASDVEVSRDGPSFTFDTLTALRVREPGAQFFFVTGADAFAEIASWRRYPEVLELAHFVVIARPGTALTSLRARLPQLAPRMVDGGRRPAAPPSGTASPSIFLVAAATPDVSSTEVRQRVADGLSLDGLVPPAVARYIADHRLYA
jgi:nicotinate-nucleotide adenylyltransferase